MASTASILAQAASGGIRAAEQVQGTAISAEAGNTAATEQRAQTSATTLNTAASQLGQIAGQMASTLEPSQQATIQRNLNALGLAETQINNGLGRLIASNPDTPVGPVLQSAVDLFSGALSSVRNGFSASGLQPAAVGSYSNPISTLSQPEIAIPSEAVGAQPHLLILTNEAGDSYYFGLSTTAHDRLVRSTQYSIAAQERLLREDAQQAVGIGGETLSLSGVVIPKLKGAGRQIDRLRALSRKLLPCTLTTGYGDVLGRWYLTQIEEEQGHLMSDGAPRRQSFRLEFVRYGNDRANQ